MWFRKNLEVFKGKKIWLKRSSPRNNPVSSSSFFHCLSFIPHPLFRGFFFFYYFSFAFLFSCISLLSFPLLAHPFLLTCAKTLTLELKMQPLKLRQNPMMQHSLYHHPALITPPQVPLFTCFHSLFSTIYRYFPFTVLILRLFCFISLKSMSNYFKDYSLHFNYSLIDQHMCKLLCNLDFLSTLEKLKS